MHATSESDADGPFVLAHAWTTLMKIAGFGTRIAGQQVLDSAPERHVAKHIRTVPLPVRTSLSLFPDTAMDAAVCYEQSRTATSSWATSLVSSLVYLDSMLSIVAES